MPSHPMDLIIEAGLIVTMNGDRALIGDGAMAVHDGRILAVDRLDVIANRYKAARTVGDRHSLAMPASSTVIPMPATVS